MKKTSFILNTIIVSILLFILLNIAIAITWEIRTNLKFKNFKAYDDKVLKVLNLNEKEGLKLYLETFIDRKFDYEQFTEHAENTGFNNKYVNVTPKEGRKTISPKYCDKNIFFYGGSTTFGYNVTDKQTIASYLGNYLIDNDLRICVKNYGRGSYFSTQENILFQKHILNKIVNSKDIVIFIDGINENGNKVSRNTEFLFQANKIINQKHWDMYKLSLPFFFNTLPINQFINRLSSKIKFKEEQKKNPQNIFSKDEMAKYVYQTNVNFRIGICKNLKIECYSFFQPFPVINGKYFDEQPSGASEVRRILNKEERKIINQKYFELKSVDNIYDISQSINNMTTLSYVDAVHYSPRANEIIAMTIIDVIKDHFNE